MGPHRRYLASVKPGGWLGSIPHRHSFTGLHTAVSHPGPRIQVLCGRPMWSAKPKVSGVGGQGP